MWGLIIIIAAMSSFLFFKTARSKTTNEKPMMDSPETTKSSPMTIEAPKLSSDTDTSKLDIPILMYHYIRVVADPNDKLGINLSVTPNKFAKQLDYLQTKGYHTINFQDVLTGNIPANPIILTFDDGYEDFYTAAYPELKKHNMTAVSFIITGKSDSNYMTKAQIKSLSDAGIEIGSHTISHPDLSTLSEAKANVEINSSKTELENIIGRKVISFCYPSGKYTDKTIDSVKNAGYLFATTTKSGIGEFKEPLSLHRYRMNADSDISAFIK